MSFHTPYDPVARAQTVARWVCRNNQRKHHCLRPVRCYGGIATMLSFSPPLHVKTLRARLARAGLFCRTACAPHEIPPEQV
jgi:uncharacterized Fe-S cluster-containing radical SAM superfamily protein